jgi:hypothetical protein
MQILIAYGFLSVVKGKKAFIKTYCGSPVTVEETNNGFNE